MKTTGKMIVISLLICAAMTVGCTKKVKVTIANHSDISRSINLTVPDGTMVVGSVGAGSRLMHTLTVKTADLPAQCNYSAGPGGVSQSFTVTEDSPDKWWFHITAQGRMTGPYTKDDVHTETEDLGEIEVEVNTEMLVR